MTTFLGPHDHQLFYWYFLVSELLTEDYFCVGPAFCLLPHPQVASAIVFLHWGYREIITFLRLILILQVSKPIRITTSQAATRQGTHVHSRLSSLSHCGLVMVSEEEKKNNKA